MSRRVFLDYASATPVDPRVLEVMLPYFSGRFSNPSSLYYSGKLARDAVEKARDQVAQSIGGQANEVIFTSGGTEANNLAILGTAYARQNEKRSIVTCKTEHQSILEPCRFLEKTGWELSYLPLDAAGIVQFSTDSPFIENLALCSVMLVNNETGIVQPVKEIAHLVKRRAGYMHTDACQALGHLDINVNLLKVDLLTLNSSKIYGPKGVGALYVRKGTALNPQAYGGKQEFGMRPGTENVSAIVGFGFACTLAVQEMQQENERLCTLQNNLLAELLKIPGVHLNGDLKQRVPNIINISVSGIEPESLLFYLNSAGIEVSSSSACAQTSGASHVLLALGLDPLRAQSSIRISFGRMTTEEEVDFFINTLLATVEKLRILN